MAKIFGDGKIPKRIESCVTYPLGDDIIIRAISGFTTQALLKSPKYELSRQNASEFGRVSSTCKHLRLALQMILPKKNNLAVVNCLIKKMRAVLVFDVVSARGERTLARALATEDGRQQLAGYHFNPDGAIALEYVLANGVVQLVSSSLDFPDGANSVCCSLVALAFDFDTEASSFIESEKQFYNSATLPDNVSIVVPDIGSCVGILFTILVVRYYVQNVDGYVPIADDRSTVVVVLD